MTPKQLRLWKEQVGNGKDIIVSKSVKTIHPVVSDIVTNLAQIEVINFIKVKPDFIAASNEVKGQVKDPIDYPGHQTAIGISITIITGYKTLDFYGITSAVKGYGRRMVDAVLRDLPKEWTVSVLMDWSGGFWDEMKAVYPNTNWAEW